MESQDGIRESELLKKTKISRPHFFRVMKLLEKKGVITRTKSSDGKVVMVKPSQGYVMVANANCASLEFLLLELDNLGDMIMKDSQKVERCLDGRKI